MSNYVKSTNFATKDSLVTGNPAKIVKGTEIDTEFNAIATAVATKADTSYVDAAISEAGTGSVSSVATGTGLTGGPITTTGTISLADSGVTAGTYGQAGVSYPIITVDAKGRITSASLSTNFGSGGSTGVTSFNSRTGVVTLSNTDVVTALGYTPYNGSTNPNGYVTSTSLLSSNNTWSGTNTFTNTVTANNGFIAEAQNYTAIGTSSYAQNSGTGTVGTQVAFSTRNSGGLTGTDTNWSVKFIVGSTAGENANISGLNFRAADDNSKSLGTSSLRWSVVYAATGTINTSDARLKTDIKPTALGLNFIKQLNPVSYKWISGGKVNTGKVVKKILESGETINVDEVVDVVGTRTHYGLLAQEVKQVVDNSGVGDFAGWVIGDKNNPNSEQGLRYDQFIAPLIKAVQELSAEVEALKAKLAA